MKPLLTAVLTLAALFCAALMNCRTASCLAQQMNASLSQSASYAQSGDWVAAGREFDDAYAQWDSHRTYLHVTIAHNEINDAEDLFQQAQAYAVNRDATEYCVRLSGLSTALDQLQETQRFSIKNIL